MDAGISFKQILRSRFLTVTCKCRSRPQPHGTIIHSSRLWPQTRGY